LPLIGREAVFQNERRIEILDLQEPLGGLLESFLRNQSHNFAGDGNHSVASRLALHVFEYAVDRRLLEIG
jgi:hypothetical protein